jgi:hypothetical protein
MKKILFGLIATVFFGLSANAQKFTKEEARIYAAKAYVNFKNSLSEYQKNSKSYDHFISIVINPTGNNIPSEGANLLKIAYNDLKNKTNDETILKNYSGKEIADALRYLKKNPNKTEEDLFGLSNLEKTSLQGKGGPSGEIMITFNEENTVGCRWYQIRCWFSEIFGPELGDKVLKALIDAIIALL